MATDERHSSKGGQAMSDRADRLRELVSDVAAAYFSNTPVSPTEIAGVLDQIASSLGAIGGRPPAAAPEPEVANEREPRLTAAQIRNSVKPDGIVSFEDGRSYKTLKRHLSRLGMSPTQYRQKWGLPPDYPMVAANLSAARSELARGMRLGRSANPGQEPVVGFLRKHASS
jgi:predicted transcriptional regulator